MYKTFNINLAGISFTINEDAYQTLNNYFKSVREFYAEEAEKDEIVKDIEVRFAELFISNGKEKIISLNDVETVIQKMGKPQDFGFTEETGEHTTQENNAAQQTEPIKKRLYRDVDDNVVAGVCSGLSNYLGIEDPIWLRILFIISPFITFGTALLIYVILWIAIPEAKSKSQKLQMKGQPINLANLTSNFNINTDKSNPLNKIVSIIGEIVKYIFKAILFIGKFILYIFIFCIALSIIFSIIAFIISVITAAPLSAKFFFVNSKFATLLFIGGLVVGISVLIAFILWLINIFSTTTKPLTKKIGLTLGGILLIGLILLGIVAKESKSYFNERSKLSQSVPLQMAAIRDTLRLDITNIEKEDMDIQINGFDDLMNFLGRDVKITPDVEIKIIPSITDSFYITKEFSSFGKNEKEALQNATSIEHNLTQKNEYVLVDPYFSINTKNFKLRNQKLIVKVYVPEGKVIAWNERTENFMDESSLPINWDKDVIKDFNMDIKGNKDSSKVTININGNTIKIDGDEETININGSDIDVNNEEEIEDELDSFFEREHYMFVMKNRELIPID